MTVATTLCMSWYCKHWLNITAYIHSPHVTTVAFWWAWPFWCREWGDNLNSLKADISFASSHVSSGVKLTRWMGTFHKVCATYCPSRFCQPTHPCLQIIHDCCATSITGCNDSSRICSKSCSCISKCDADVMLMWCKFHADCKKNQQKKQIMMINALWHQ